MKIPCSFPVLGKIPRKTSTTSRTNIFFKYSTQCKQVSRQWGRRLKGREILNQTTYAHNLGNFTGVNYYTWDVSALSMQNRLATFKRSLFLSEVHTVRRKKEGRLGSARQSYARVVWLTEWLIRRKKRGSTQQRKHN